jgi:hypothetical protein
MPENAFGKKVKRKIVVSKKYKKKQRKSKEMLSPRSVYDRISPELFFSISLHESPTRQTILFYNELKKLKEVSIENIFFIMKGKFPSFTMEEGRINTHINSESIGHLSILEDYINNEICDMLFAKQNILFLCKRCAIKGQVYISLTLTHITNNLEDVEDVKTSIYNSL